MNSHDIVIKVRIGKIEQFLIPIRNEPTILHDYDEAWESPYVQNGDLVLDGTTLRRIWINGKHRMMSVAGDISDLGPRTEMRYMVELLVNDKQAALVFVHYPTLSDIVREIYWEIGSKLLPHQRLEIVGG